MGKKALWLIPIGLIALYLYERSRLNFRIIGFKLNPKPSIVIQLLNPAQVPALVQSVVLDVIFKGSAIGTITNFNQLVIPANNSANINLDMNLNSFGLIALASGLVQDASGFAKNISISLVGTINVDGLSIPVNETYNIK